MHKADEVYLVRKRFENNKVEIWLEKVVIRLD